MTVKQREKTSDIEDDPVETMLKKTGCIELHYKVQECIAASQDWRKCQDEVNAFRSCMSKHQQERSKLEKHEYRRKSTSDLDVWARFLCLKLNNNNQVSTATDSDSKINIVVMDRLGIKMFRKLSRLNINCSALNYTTRVEIDSTLKDEFDSQQYKPRKHPGKIRIKTASIPPSIQKAIKVVLDDNNGKSLYQDSGKLSNYLRSRLLPPEEGEIDEKAKNIYNTVSAKVYSKLPENLSEEELEKSSKAVDMHVFNVLRKNVYGWANIVYDQATSLQYLIARASPEYAVLLRILDDIKRIYPEYKPRSFFDFGSGVGTGTWAVNETWKNDIFEYFCVDTSQDMHDLARLILCGGKDNVEIPYKAFYQRQFLPASANIKYNIVLSAYSLFELPNIKSRLETIQKLWNKTEDFLIIVEQGTRAGFKIVNEAREFILNMPKGKNQHGYVLSPCPNDSVCPRYMEQDTPCNFLMKYQNMSFIEKSGHYSDLFTYVILRKGKRPEDDPQWPRVVRAPLVRSGHTVCRLCTSQGELREIIFSKAKFDQTTYRCARSSNWGDLLPIKL